MVSNGWLPDCGVIGAEGATDLLTFQLERSSVTLTDKTGVTDEPRVVKGFGSPQSRDRT